MDYYADYHVHTDISFDSDASMEQQAEAARERGVHELAFTDHYDPDYPYEGFEDPDLPLYFANLENVRAAFPDITFRAAMEVGPRPGTHDTARAKIASYPFDFILLSKHVVNGKDPWYPDFYEGLTQREGEELYLQEILDDVRTFGDFDVVGHIGYADRYLDRSATLTEILPRFTWEDFPDLIDAILRTVIENGKGIEINTSDCRVHGYPAPHPSIIRRYAQFGGEILTIGSDAHGPDRVAERFREAHELAAACGLRYVCTFEHRRPVFRRLDA